MARSVEKKPKDYQVKTLFVTIEKISIYHLLRTTYEDKIALEGTHIEITMHHDKYSKFNSAIYPKLTVSFLFFFSSLNALI